MVLMSTPEPESETPPENEMTTALLPSPGPETEIYHPWFASENETAATKSRT